MAIGEYVEQKLPEFTYYRSSTNARHGSSTITVSNPLASAGIRTLVYEMPEWAFYDQAYEETKNYYPSVSGYLKVIMRFFIFSKLEFMYSTC